MGRYIQPSDLSDRMGTDAFTRIFDKGGDFSTGSGRIVSDAIAAAENHIDLRLRASHGTPFTGTIPPGIQDIACMLAVWCALRFQTAATANKPFKDLFDEADALISKLAKDREARLPTQTAEPVASAPFLNDPLPVPVFNRVAGLCGPGIDSTNGTGRSGF